MRLTPFALASFLVLILCSVAICQESNAPPEPERANVPADLPSLIKTFSGKWSLRVRFEPSSEMPKGFDGEGEESWRSGPGGITLLEEERLPTPNGNMYLLGLIWSDEKTKSLHGMECNNQHPYTCDLKGALNDITLSWNGKQFVIDEQETHGSKKYLWHEVWSDITENSFTQTGDMQEAGGHSTRLMTIHGTKSAEHSGTH
jgi:hypothetical protein